MAETSFNVTREEVEMAFSTCSNKVPPQIKISDLRLVMRGLGFDPRNSQIEEMVKKITETKKRRGDVDNAEFIDVDEFLEVVKSGGNEADKSLEEMRSAFRLFDKEGKGWITVNDLRQVAKELGEDISTEELEEMLAEASRNSAGKVDEHDFFTIMKKTCLY